MPEKGFKIGPFGILNPSPKADKSLKALF